MNEGSKILVVDDDDRVVRLVGRYLEQEGYRVSSAGNGRQMREALRTTEPDLVILDLTLPGEDGLTLARELRARSRVPIIILSGKSHTVDKVVGLELGADDYVTKPFEERELLARVRTVLRRYRASADEQPASPRRVARFRDWQLDFVAHELISPAGQRVHLTSHEFQLLEAFVTRPNRTLSRDTLMDLVSGRDWNPVDRSIDVLVAKLRRKLTADPDEAPLITTMRGAGYKFTVPVELG